MEKFQPTSGSKMKIGQDEIMLVLDYLRRSPDGISIEERYIVTSEVLKAVESQALLDEVIEFLFANRMMAETSISRKLKIDLADFSIFHRAAAFSVLCLYEYFFKMSSWLEEATVAKGGNTPHASFPSLRFGLEKDALRHNLDEVIDFFRRKMTIYAMNFANSEPLPERERHLKKLISFLTELAYEGNTSAFDGDLNYLKGMLASLTDSENLAKKRNNHIFKEIGEDIFDRIVSQIEMTEANLSQLYRRMFDDGLVHCKAEKFREWVNETYSLEIGKIRTKKDKISELDQLYFTVIELFKRRN